MLYANPNAQDFHHIAEVFRKIGIPEKGNQCIAGLSEPRKRT